MDILIINLRSIGGDDGLAGALEDISSGVLVILEDVDSILATHSREGEDAPTDDDREDVTLGGLLNVLDGQMTPHGCIFGLTTNYLDRLDKAIYREGRVECLEELGYMDNFQLRNLYKHFFKKDPDNTVPTITPDHKITPAMIISVFRN
ncbi:AAA family ATPase, partial [Klebsiella pneumoniae]|uniref:AAA family ATPase n=1 Tax=Klebsiella pneumoniae TaxID=573 RepID=UPI001E4ACCC0